MHSSESRFAVTTWQGRVAPVFDVCHQLLVVDVVDGDVVATTPHRLDEEDAYQRARRVVELCGATLVCGAISEPLARWIRDQGVRVLGFVAGEVDRIVQACVSGRLPCAEFAMPGCVVPARRRARRRRGHEPSGGCSPRGPR
jgi:predicted Fe-Mo cluster-binding NifX family protein